MGLLDWFFKRSVSVLVPDTVWINSRAKLVGLLREIKRLPSGSRAVLVAHFPTTVSAFADALHQCCIPFEHGETAMTAAQVADMPPGLILIRSDNLKVPYRPHRAAVQTNHVQGQRVTVLAAERYPLPEKDQRLEDFVASLPEGSSLGFHASLDDIVIRAFSGDRTVRVLQMLGMDDNTPIVDRRMTRSLQRAQRKLASKVTLERPCNSPEEWISRNLSGLGMAEAG